MKLRFATFVLDTECRQLFRNDQPVHLSPKAFELLQYLAEQRPKAVTKTELYQRIWPGTYVVDANLTVLVAELRRALGDDPQAPQYIRTVPKFGYAFCAEAAAIGEPALAENPRIGLTWNDRVLFLTEGETVLGRDPSCGIWLDRPGVSRRHARVMVRGDAATIEDLGSKNGTFVGHKPIEGTRQMVDGDLIHVGPVELQFRVWTTDGVETERIQRSGQK